jgi:hypothetical protein
MDRSPSTVTGAFLGVDPTDGDTRTLEEVAVSGTVSVVDSAGTRSTPRFSRRLARRNSRKNTGSLRMRIDFCLAGSEDPVTSGSGQTPDAGYQFGDADLARIPA